MQFHVTAFVPTGAIMAQGFSDVSIYDSSFQATSSGGDGGAVAVEGSKLRVDHSHFSHCVASESGGTLPPALAEARPGPSNCQESDTRSVHTAGAVSGGEYAHSAGVEASSITLSASSFEGCDLLVPTVLTPRVLTLCYFHALCTNPSTPANRSRASTDLEPFRTLMCADAWLGGTGAV